MKTTFIENFLKMNPQVPQYSSKNQSYLLSGVNPLYYLEDGTQEEQAAPMAASVDWSQITPSLLASFSEANVDTDQKLYVTQPTYIYGESFLNVNALTLQAAKAWIKKVDAGGLGSSNVFMKIWAHTGTFGVNGTPTGAFLAISDAVSPSATITTSYVLTKFVFTGANKIALTANTPYFITIEFGGGDASNYIVTGKDASSPSTTGNAAFSSNGSAWTSTTAAAMAFYVYGGGVTNNIVEGNIVHMIPSTGGTYVAYAITDTTKVYGLTTTDITDLGYPSGSSVANSGGYLAIGGGGTTASGYLFATYASSGSVYRMTLPSSSWSAYSTNPLQTSIGVHIMEPFLDFIAIKDGNTSYTQGSWIRHFDMSALTMSTLPALDIGTGFGIIQMRNLNNKYLAIAGGKTAGGTINGYPQNYIFLWDGISSRYQYAVKVPGQFIDMRVIDSILYVAVQVSSGKTCLFYLYNTTLRKSLTPQIAKIAGIINAPVPCSLFDFHNYVGIHLNVTNDFTDPLMVFGKDEAGDIEFVHSYGRKFDQMTVSYDGNLFANLFVNGGSSVLFYLPTTGNYTQILYRSQWIPVKNLQGIDIYYDTPPQIGTDLINVTIYGEGEDIIAGNSTTVLTAINSTNILSKKRTRLDVKGFTGNMVMVQLSTVNSTWRPIIRAIGLITP